MKPQSENITIGPLWIVTRNLRIDSYDMVAWNKERAPVIRVLRPITNSVRDQAREDINATPQG